MTVGYHKKTKLLKIFVVIFSSLLWLPILVYLLDNFPIVLPPPKQGRQLRVVVSLPLERAQTINPLNQQCPAKSNLGPGAPGAQLPIMSLRLP